MHKYFPQNKDLDYLTIVAGKNCFTQSLNVKEYRCLKNVIDQIDSK